MIRSTIFSTNRL